MEMEMGTFRLTTINSRQWALVGWVDAVQAHHLHPHRRHHSKYRVEPFQRTRLDNDAHRRILQQPIEVFKKAKIE